MADHPRLMGRRAFMGTLGTGCISFTAGCTTSAGSATSSLRMGTLQPPVTLDPITAKYVGSDQTIQLVFDGLYTYLEGGNLQPAIAEGSPSDEGEKTFRVSLKNEARFHTGDPVTAADVKYSYEAPVEEETAAKAAVEPIESIEAVDERTVEFTLSQPFPDRPRLLTRPIVPKSVRESDREHFATHPVGAGPYTVTSFTEEKRAKLSKWQEYGRSPTPAIDRVSVVYIESPVTQMMSLVSNRTDLVTPVSPQLHPKFRDVTGATLASTRGYRSYYLGFNTNQGPTTQRTVRNAIWHCIDLEETVAELLAPFGRRQYGLVPRQVAARWEFPRDDWQSRVPEKDTERARRLFEKADAAAGQFKILTSKDPKHRELGAQMARGLRDAGHGALVKSHTWKSYLERYVSGAEDEYSIFVGEIAGTPDPDSYFYPLVHENMQGITNGLFFNDEPVMNAILAARETTDRNRRRDLYTMAMERLLDERVVLPVASVRNSFAHSKQVRGFDVHPIAQLNPRLAGPNGTVTMGGDG